MLHALLLFLLPVLKDAQRRISAPPLTAHLEAPRPAQPAPAPVPPKFEPLPPSPVRPAPVTKAAPRALASPPILSIERAPQAAEPAFVVAAPVSALAQIAQDPAANTAAQPGPQPAAAAARGPDAGAIGRYRLELMDVARRYKRYPRIAQDNNWEGRVELRVVIGQDGAISSFTVKKGAGRAVLDEQAQELIRVAQSKVTMPAALRGTAFNLDIAVDYYLKDEEK